MSTDVQTRPKLRPSSSDLWFLAYLPLAVSDGVAMPLIPLLALQHFGASAFAVTIIIAASAMSQVPFTIIWGNLSDRVAHRKFFLVGSFLATGASLILIAFARDIGTYFWLNVVEGLASAASAPIGTMLLLETRHKRWWPSDIGLFGLISGVGTTAGLALGFVWLFVLQINQSAIQVMTALLVVSGVLALVSAYLAYAWIEEPAVRLDRRTLADLLNLHRGVVERIRHMRNRVLNVIDLTRPSAGRLPRREILFLVALGVMTVGFDVFYGPFPVFLNQSLQLGDADIFIVYLAASATSTLLFFHSGKVVESHSPKFVFLESLAGRVLLLGLFLWAPVYYVFGLGTPHLLLWVTLLNGLMGVTWAFISTASTLFLVRVVGRTKRGQALGLYNAVAGAGGLFGTLLGGFLFATFGFSAAYSVAAITVLAGAVLLLPIPFHVFLAPQPVHRRSALKGVRATSPPGLTARPPPHDLTAALGGHQR